MTSDALLRCRGLSAAVEEKAILHEVNLEVAQGQVHVLMGPNGAGKSTLGHVLMGDPAYEVTAGEIFFDGADITELAPDKRSRAGLFLSFQAPVEIPGVPLRSFLRAMMEGRGEKLKNKEFRRKTQELAETLDMDPAYLDRELGVGFSGGEKKKAEILQLLMLRPKFAILDETDSGLDVDAVRTVSRGIEEYQKKRGGALLVITHSTKILESLHVDYTHVLVKGTMVTTGGPELVDEINAHGFEKYVGKEDSEKA